MQQVLPSFDVSGGLQERPTRCRAALTSAVPQDVPVLRMNNHSRLVTALHHQRGSRTARV
jgi:hypothetical protein